MAVAIKAAYGATPTYSSDLSSGQFKFRSDDDPTNTDNSAQILKPTSGSNYSYWVHLCLEFTGTFTQYTNIKVYSDGTNSWGNGIDMLVGLRDSGDAGCPTASYQQANGTEGETGYYIGDGTNGHAYYNGQTTPTGSIFDYTEASPLDLDSNTYTSDGDKSYFAVLQLKVESTATAGTYSGENIIFRYDETP